MYEGDMTHLQATIYPHMSHVSAAAAAEEEEEEGEEEICAQRRTTSVLRES